MFSVCRTSAAAVLSRQALLTKSQPGLLLRLLHWEFGDLGSTLCKAQHPQSLGEQQCVGTDRGGGWKHGQPGRVGPAGQDTGTCWLLSLPSFVPAAPWERQNLVGHSRKVREGHGQCGQAGVDRMRILLSSTGSKAGGWRAGRSSSTSPALRACFSQDESPKSCL